MPVFRLGRADRARATTKKGEMEAANEAAVMAQLRAQAIVADRGEDEGRATCFEHPASASGGSPRKDLVIFTRQFATMIDAGLPLVQCLDILADQQQNKTLQGDRCAR